MPLGGSAHNHRSVSESRSAATAVGGQRWGSEAADKTAERGETSRVEGEGLG